MTESTNLTSLAPNSITDASGGVWGLAPRPLKGIRFATTAPFRPAPRRALLLYDNHAGYHENTSGNWYVYSNVGWSQTTDPRIQTEPPSSTSVTM
jgi:hypothetical protein